MHKLLRRLFLFDVFSLKTKLPAETVLSRIASLADPEYSDYHGHLTSFGFVLAENSLKHSEGVTVHNSFTPVAVGRVNEENGMTTVSGIIRMNLAALIPFAIIYVCSLFSLVFFPVMHILLHFAFYKPARRMKKALERLLTE